MSLQKERTVIEIVIEVSPVMYVQERVLGRT
jgi:hypothetical protein